jgi:hypothetical protein
MTQRVPADARLGRTNANKVIGYRIIHLDRSLFASWTAAQETTIPGHYTAVGGVAAPDAGGYIVWGTEAEDLAETGIEPVQPDAMPAILERIAAMLDSLSERILRAVSLIPGSVLVETDTTQLDAAIGRLVEMAEAAKQLRQAVVIAEHMSGNLAEYANAMSRVQELDAAQRRRLVAIEDFLQTVEEALR